MGDVDPFEMDTEHLNALMRECVDALSSQVKKSPVAPDETVLAARRLEEAAADFTNTLFRGHEERGTRGSRFMKPTDAEAWILLRRLLIDEHDFAVGPLVERARVYAQNHRDKHWAELLSARDDLEGRYSGIPADTEEGVLRTLQYVSLLLIEMTKENDGR